MISLDYAIGVPMRCSRFNELFKQTPSLDFIVSIAMFRQYYDEANINFGGGNMHATSVIIDI